LTIDNKKLRTLRRKVAKVIILWLCVFGGVLNKEKEKNTNKFGVVRKIV
jgi:hypothetical protein